MESLQTLPPVMSNQQLVDTKLVKSSEKIIGDIREIVNRIIGYSKNGDMQALSLLVKQLNTPLPQVDERTNKLFNKMLEKINDALDNDVSFVTVCKLMEKMLTDFRKKLVETTAMPTIKQLVVDLDNINTSFVEAIISS